MIGGGGVEGAADVFGGDGLDGVVDHDLQDVGGGGRLRTRLGTGGGIVLSRSIAGNAVGAGRDAQTAGETPALPVVSSRERPMTDD